MWPPAVLWLWCGRCGFVHGRACECCMSYVSLALRKDGQTPLHAASEGGHVKVVRALLAAGSKALDQANKVVGLVLLCAQRRRAARRERARAWSVGCGWLAAVMVVCIVGGM